MIRRYPHPCVRCGMCCLSRPCPVALDHGHAPATGRCRHLRYPDGVHADCGLSRSLAASENLEEHQISALFGFGAGCCLKGRAVDTTTGRQADFASLPPEMKLALAARARR